VLGGSSYTYLEAFRNEGAYSGASRSPIPLEADH
jgi:hypothetical protein